MTAHWLKNVLVRAGVSGADALDLPPALPLRDAWQRVAQSLHLQDEAVAAHVASRFHLRQADLASAAVNVAKLVPESIARKHRVVPLREDDHDIVVATSDPTDIDAEQAISFASGRQVSFEVAPPAAIDAEIERRYAHDAAVTSLLQRVDAAPADGVRIVDEIAGAVSKAHGGESSAVVKLANLLLDAAVEHRASALEIVAAGGQGSVSFRVDSVWMRFMQMPLPAMHHVIGRLRVIGNVGIAGRGKSRDGSARVRIEGKEYDLRVSMGTSGGAPRALVRIYDQQFRPLLAELGLSPDSDLAIRELLAGAGFVIVTGPMDSGAAVVLYAALRDLATSRRVAFAEDVLRWDVAGVQHIPLDPASGAEALRRAAQEVDVLAVGTLSDVAVAQTLAEAAARGKLAIARVEASSVRAAVDEVARLVGHASIPGLRAAIAVRHFRNVCQTCAAAAGTPGPSCESCHGTGFRGLSPVLAVLTPGDAAGWSEQGGLSAELRAHVAAGTTTEAEAERILSGGGIDAAPPGDRPRILVADDDPLIRLLARTVLEADGLEVTEASDGADAVTQVSRATDLSLVILDLDMPRLDGHAVLARLKREVRTAGIPVVVLTASTNPADEAKALDSGADDYIRKPIDPPRFLARVRAVLRRASG